MPELPEVETVMRGLQPVLEGATIAKATAYTPKLRIDIPSDFTARLTGNTVTRLKRRSKYILMEMQDGLIMILHLGMSGKITIFDKHLTAPPRIKHDHIELITTTGATVRYNDARRFGMLTFTDINNAAYHSLLVGIGPEPLSNAFHSDILKKAFQNKKSPVKTALLDQRIVAGLGNIYVCEVLHRSRICPTRLACDINEDECEALVPTIREVLYAAIQAGGSTLKDFAHADGSLGYFQHRFQVYGREDEHCLNHACGGKIKRITQAGRSSFYCPTCQS